MGKENEHGFAKAIRGYNTDEVDAYIDTLNSRYKALEEDNALLADRASNAKAELDESNTKRGLAEKQLADAQRQAEDMLTEARAEAQQIIADAKARAALIESDARIKADETVGAAILKEQRINSELERKIVEKEQVYNAFCDKVNSFKNSIFSQYAAHITALEEILAHKVEYSYELREIPKTEPAVQPKEDIPREEVIAPAASEPDAQKPDAQKPDAADASTSKNPGIKIKRQPPRGEKVSSIMRELDEIKTRIAEKDKKNY